MNQNFWLIIVFITRMVCNSSCRPQDGASTFTAPIKSAVELVESETPKSSIDSSTEVDKFKLKEEEKINDTKEAKLNIESIANVARASNDGPSLPSSITYGQLFDTVGQMVDSDVRTPPKLSQFIKDKHTERKDSMGDVFKAMPVTFIYEDEDSLNQDVTEKLVLEDASEGKATRSEEGVQGIAIPVLMDDVDYNPTTPPKKLQKIPEVPKPAKDEKKKSGVTKYHPTTTPSSKLSTWILLSDNKDSTTPLPKKNNNKKINGNDDNDGKKKNSGTNSTTKKPVKIPVTTLKAPSTSVQKKVTIKPVSSNTKKPEPNTSATSALEALLKTQKKNSTTTSKPKNGAQRKPTIDPTKKFEEKMDVVETKDRHEILPSETKTTYTIPTKLMLTTEEGISVTEPNSSTLSDKTSQETTKKKKSSSKKKKKNKNKKKKTETGVEMKTPDQPVGSQIYNFLSREIVPTVGLGLIGVALTAGLASFLGYNPFATATVPLRRTYETNHGYSPSLNYDYNANYGDGGQSEEVLFREVLSGMPESSRYDLSHSDSSYQDSYSRQDQAYPTGSGTTYQSEKNVGTYDSNYSQDYSYGMTFNEGDKKYSTDNEEKYPVYTRESGTSFVYPETTGITSVDKNTRLNDDQGSQTQYGIAKIDTIERQPEALYRVAGESNIQYRTGESTIHGINSQNNWHRVGKPMESIRYYSHVEPGPRSLDLNKEYNKYHETKKRSKRGTDSVIQRIARKRTKKENDAENEIDFDESFNDQKNEELNFNDIPFTTTSSKVTTVYEEIKTSTPETTETSTAESNNEKISTTTDETKDSESTESLEPIDSNVSTTTASNAMSVLDVLKRLAQFKLRLGLSFLRSTTDMFSRYLDDIQRRVDESFTNTTTTTVHYNKKRNIWSRIFSRGELNEPSRKKRSTLNGNQFLSSLLTEEDKQNSKSTKKDLRFSPKIFLQKKNVPKKYESNARN